MHLCNDGDALGPFRVHPGYLLLHCFLAHIIRLFKFIVVEIQLSHVILNCQKVRVLCTLVVHNNILCLFEGIFRLLVHRLVLLVVIRLRWLSFLRLLYDGLLLNEAWTY